MLPHDEIELTIPRGSLRGTIKYTFPQAWAAGPKFCVAMALAAVLGAILAPVAVIILAILVSNIEKLIAGASDGLVVLTPWILLAGGAALIGGLCNSIMQFSKRRLGDELSLSLQKKILFHASQLDLKTLEDRNTRNIIERAKQEPGKNVLNFSEGLLKVVASFVQVFSLAAILFWIEPIWSSILMLFGLPFILLKWYLSGIQYRLKRNKTTLRRWTRYYAKKISERDSVPSTKILRLSELLLDRYETTMRNILQTNGQYYRTEALATLTSTFVLIGVLMIAMVVVGRQAAVGALSVAQFIAFWMASWRFKGSLGNLAGSFSTVWKAQLSILNTREFLDIESSIQNDGTLCPSTLPGKIELINLSFSYPNSKHPTIRNISLTIHPGETVAIVGPNGAGKTTLAKLLTRLYQTGEGEIRIDGAAINEFDLDYLHDRMAFVFQHPARFEGTAIENIAFGDWRNLLDSPEKVRRIAESACVDQMIQKMPQGYDTLLGRLFGDYDLSGGQWQKIAIARALACDPSIVILDEPAANLDVHSEYALYQGINELIHDRTTILISHRFSTVRMADRIFVLDEGRLIEEGTHEELVTRRGTYSTMCEMHEATVRIQAPHYSRIPTHHKEVSIDS